MLYMITFELSFHGLLILQHHTSNYMYHILPNIDKLVKMDILGLFVHDLYLVNRLRYLDTALLTFLNKYIRQVHTIVVIHGIQTVINWRKDLQVRQVCSTLYSFK